jgi:hypothetical protein
MPKTVLIICRTNLEKAPRFLTQVEALCKDYAITASGLSGDSHSKKYKFIPLAPKIKNQVNVTFHLKQHVLFRKLVSFFLRMIYYKSIDSEKREFNENFNNLKKQNYQLVIAHHLDDLPLGVKLAQYKKVKLIFNAHEYYPLQFSDREDWMRNSYPYMVKKAKDCFKYVDACFCVGTKIAEKYKEEFNLNSVVITNAKPFYDLVPASINEGQKIKLIHHGAANSSRKIELMIEVMDFLGSDYTLDLILVPGEVLYIEELKKMASNNSNINFPDSVSTNDISAHINKYDIGIYILPPTNFNSEYALPNKFFEFIQARLAIATSPSLEMANLVNQYDLGVVADDYTPKALADKIKSMTVEKIMFHKYQSHKYAKILSADENRLKIKEIVAGLV